MREAVEGAGARLLYLPPYPPALSPIELCWSKVRQALRSAAARTAESLGRAIREAFAAVPIEDLRNWFRHCGYGAA